MQKILKKALVLIAMVFCTSFITSHFSLAPVFAAPNDTSTIADEKDPHCRDLLGMVSWDCHVNFNPQNEDELAQNVAAIATNIFLDLTVLASYLVLGFTIYGGYLYIFSAGDPGKAMAAKRTLSHAFIGLAIVLSANVILNTVRIALLGTGGAFNCNPTEGTSCAEPGEVVSNLVNWLIGISGTIALAFILVGGLGYMTSAGDVGKLQKAKRTILYALIGLAITGLSAVISAFVTNLIQNANNNTDAPQAGAIMKEISYEK